MSTNPVIQSLASAEAAIEEARAQVEAKEAEAVPEPAPAPEPVHAAAETPAPPAEVSREEFDLLLEQFRDLVNRVQDFNRRSGQKI